MLNANETKISVLAYDRNIVITNFGAQYPFITTRFNAKMVAVRVQFCVKVYWIRSRKPNHPRDCWGVSWERASSNGTCGLRDARRLDTCIAAHRCGSSGGVSDFASCCDRRTACRRWGIREPPSVVADEGTWTSRAVVRGAGLPTLLWRTHWPSRNWLEWRGSPAIGQQHELEPQRKQRTCPATRQGAL